jgi:hypothetical protein
MALAAPPDGALVPLFAAITVATAMLTATAPTPMTAGSDLRRMVTRLTVPQLYGIVRRSALPDGRRIVSRLVS